MFRCLIYLFIIYWIVSIKFNIMWRGILNENFLITRFSYKKKGIPPFALFWFPYINIFTKRLFISQIISILIIIIIVHMTWYENTSMLIYVCLHCCYFCSTNVCNRKFWDSKLKHFLFNSFLGKIFLSTFLVSF